MRTCEARSSTTEDTEHYSFPHMVPVEAEFAVQHNHDYVHEFCQFHAGNWVAKHPLESGEYWTVTRFKEGND